MSTSHERFTACWQTEAPRVLAFARRHVGDEAAHDVVAETFLAAWRRWESVPGPAIGWLLVTARKVVRNRVRTNRRKRHCS
ncbi:MAG: RNA polymerase sigma factor [Nocardioides sp.]